MNDARKVRIVDVLQQRLRLDVPQSRMPVLMTAEEPPFHERDVHGGDGRRGLKTPAGSLECRYQRLLTFGFGVENVDERVGVIASLPTAGESASPKVAKNAHARITQLCGLAEKGKIAPWAV